jgi:hypothetical protein
MDPLSPPPEILFERPRRARPFITLATTVELAVVPVLFTVMAVLVYDGVSPLFTVPPPPPVWAGALVVGLFQYRRAGDLVSAGLFALAAFMLTWTLTVGVAIVIGLGKAIDCLEPNGGCLPW